MKTTMLDFEIAHAVLELAKEYRELNRLITTAAHDKDPSNTRKANMEQLKKQT